MENKLATSNLSIDVQTGALILIDMLYSQKLINKRTYDNIKAKYNNKNKKSSAQSY